MAATPHARRPAPKSPSEVKLTVEVNGDLLIHSPVWERAFADGHGTYDFSPMLREITPFIKGADLAICHVETPMTPRPPERLSGVQHADPAGRAIRKAGWRICDTASNHSVDQGQYGIDQTGRALDRAGVLHTGSFGSSAAQNRTLIVTVKGVKVAFLAYTEMTNGIALPHPWSVNLADVTAVKRAARQARQRGAQVVIVNFHWGDEYVSQPSAFQRSVADALTQDPDITAIVGQHVHVVQPIERVHGKLVVFGEGQLLSNQTLGVLPAQDRGRDDGVPPHRRAGQARRRGEHHLCSDLGPAAGLHGAPDRRRRWPATRRPPTCCAAPTTGPRRRSAGSRTWSIRCLRTSADKMLV